MLPKRQVSLLSLLWGEHAVFPSSEEEVLEPRCCALLETHLFTVLPR